MNKLNKIYTSARAFSLATKHVKTPPINLEMALVKGSKDISALVDLYSNTYLKEEPMVRAAGITDLRELTSFVSTALESQHSVLLRERSSGEVVAAASGGPVTSDTHEHLRFYADRTMKEPRSQRLVHLWADVMFQSRQLQSLHLSTLWDVSFLATTPRMRRLGLAQFLVTQQRRLATRLGYSALSIYSACPHTAQLALKLGCHGLGARPLGSYHDSTGTPWVAGEDLVEFFYCVLQPRRDGTQHTTHNPEYTNQFK